MATSNNYDVIEYNGGGLPFAYTTNRFLKWPIWCDVQNTKWHEQLEIKLILSGTADINCGTKCCRVQTGDIVVINSCEPHNTCPVDDHPVSYHLLDISPELLYSEKLRPILLPAFDTNLNFQNIIRGDAHCEGLLRAFFMEMTEKRENYMLGAVGYLTLFFHHLLCNYLTPVTFDKNIQNIRKYADRLEPAFNMIYKNYRDNLRLETLAAQCGIGENYFYKMFKLVTGQTVISYINEYRVNKAEVLLKTTVLKISEIAKLTGFQDQNYFSRVFKQIKGYVPHDCRQANSQKLC